jgi:hypothetical protein
LECILKNFKKGFNGDYGVKLTPNKLRTLCESDCPTFGVGWPPERSLDKTVVNEVFKLIVRKPEHLDKFPYIDCWQDAVLSWPVWLRPSLEETCRIMVARVATTSKCREKPKEPILAKDPRKCHHPMCNFIHPCHWHPAPYPHLRCQRGSLRDSQVGGLDFPTSSGPTDPKCTPSLTVLIPHLPFNWGYPTSSSKDRFSLLRLPPPCRCP